MTAGRRRIVVAMSGGVDSSTAAALLVEAGHEVIGVAMKTHDEAPAHNRACCTPDDMRDARRVADALGIPFYVVRYTEVFQREVIVPFARAYQRGETPNPCVECNDRVKFRPLLERARVLGADLLATGHYARLTDPGDGGAPLLRRGADRHKDQSYFLYRLRPEQTRRLVFPLGERTKAEVRAEAARLGLPVAEKRESQEICFVGAGGYAEVVERTVGPGPRGAVVDGSGQVLGTHEGIHRFTLGQRRGLRIAAPEPLYVTAIDPERGEVRVGSRDELACAEVEVGRVSWTRDPPLDGAPVWVQQRYREAPQPARVWRVRGDPARVRITFEAPVVRGAPGQAAVLYQDDVVLGGGTLLGRAA